MKKLLPSLRPSSPAILTQDIHSLALLSPPSLSLRIPTTSFSVCSMARVDSPSFTSRGERESRHFLGRSRPYMIVMWIGCRVVALRAEKRPTLSLVLQWSPHRRLDSTLERFRYGGFARSFIVRRVEGAENVLLGASE